MKKLLNILVVALAGGILFTGCYNDFENPAPNKTYTRADFGDRIISIKDFKQLFYNAYGTGAGSLAQTLVIEDDYVICGKVISSDKAGNVYKSVYIYDETSESAIELKLMVNNYVYYHPGQTIFVETKGLAIGCYRYMLSVGMPPSEAEVAKGYANGNIELPLMRDQHIKMGEMGALTAADTLVVTKDNYKTALTDAALGRLIRFEDLTYQTGEYDGDPYPNYLEQTYPDNSTEAVYATKFYKDQNLPDTYAYNYNNERYYGSSWFTYGETTTGTSGNYIVRVSGYSNFALDKLPAKGATGDITAIYTKYSSKTGSYIKYQLLLNSGSDVGFAAASSNVAGE